MVAARDIPAGTDGSAVASGGYLKTETVPRRAVVPGSVVSAAPLTSLVAKDPIYKGQQVTLRQFGPISQGGIFAKFSGKQRAVAVLGDPTQLLAGTLSEATASTSSPTPVHVRRHQPRDDRVWSCGTCSCSTRPTRARRPASSSGEKTSATLVMTDRQAQTMGWAMKNSTWFLALRPTTKPRTNSSVTSRR